MKAILSFVLVLALSCASAFAEEGSGGDAAKKQEMMKKFMQFSTPGEGHKVLAPMAGKWKYTSKWWETAEAKPQESAGTSTMKMILGGRFLQHETKGKAMGMPFEGLGLTGYNNIKKKYETIWLDSMSTGMMRGEGSYNAETKTLTDKGQFSCPMKEGDQDYRSEWKMIDKDNSVFTLYGPDESGDEFKMMEMTFKRSK